MSGDVLSREQSSALATLAGAGIGSAYYLAGGVGLALRLGHRRSVDFDFFYPGDDPTPPLRAALIRMPDLRVDEEKQGTINATLRNVKVSFLSYPYPLLEPTESLLPGIPVASLADIAAMKLSTIIARGKRRDFVDLFEICRKLPLERVIEAFRKKAGGEGYNPLIVAKALVYFADAEKDPMPVLLRPCDWGEVTRFFSAEVQRLWP